MSRLVGRSELANRIILFGATIVMAALFATALNPAFASVKNQTAGMADTPQAQTGLDWIVLAWEYKLVIAAFLAMIMLIAGALIESRRGGV